MTASLRPLHPEIHVTTAHCSPQARILASLGRIASVRIPQSVKDLGHRFYIVDITFRAVGVPSTTVQWRFADFLNLRDELYYHIRTAHRERKRSCEYCHYARETLDHAAAPPTLPRLVFASPETICHQLELFLNAVLQLAQQAKHYRDKPWCAGQAMVPLLMKRFLLGTGGDSDMDANISRRCAVDPFRPVASVGLAFS